MPKKKKVSIEELVVPRQNHKICGTICICQMTAILSGVALVYLSVAIYFPFYRAYHSGIMQEPVMCSTSRVVNAEKCTWGSCGEWCLSKSSGACIQIHVNLRHNGTNLSFDNCSNSFNKTCYGLDVDNVRKYRCKLEECKNLTGVFNCTTGVCFNITDVFECVFRSVELPPLVCSGNRGKINCMDIDGLNSCRNGNCSRINEPYNCDRRCVDIPTYKKNVILLSGDRVFLSHCKRVIRAAAELQNHHPVSSFLTALALQEDGDDDNGDDQELKETDILLASCYTVSNKADGSENLQATDCVNGTLIDNRLLDDLSNFTYLHHLMTLANDSRPRSDDEIRLAPSEMDLLIANDSRLQINLEGCVNTLRDECRDFLKHYGKDGADHNAKARFPCYFSEMDNSIVVTRFNLQATYTEFVLASTIPVVLLVVSCFTLIICQRTVEVGDDAKMRFKKRVFIPIPAIEPSCVALNADNKNDDAAVL